MQYPWYHMLSWAPPCIWYDVMRAFQLCSLYHHVITHWSVLKSCYHFQTFTDPVMLSNSAYGIVVKRSNDPITADNPVYGVRIDACICTD